MELTESEHWIMQDEIEKFLERECPNSRLVYYRQLKDGHIPMIREVKIEGTESAIQCFKRWFSSYPKITCPYSQHVVKNPHKE